MSVGGFRAAAFHLGVMRKLDSHDKLACRSELAREGGVSGNNVDWHAIFASKLAPTGIA
jgi:hypothetical protein